MTNQVHEELSKTEAGRLTIQVDNLSTAIWEIKIQMAKDRVWFSILGGAVPIFTSIITAFIIKRFI